MHSLRSATSLFYGYQYAPTMISIHALLTECNIKGEEYLSLNLEISIHALLTECNKKTPLGISPTRSFQSMHSLRSATEQVERLKAKERIFQSMHSLRSATCLLVSSKCHVLDFNPCTPYGVQQGSCQFIVGSDGISIHALLTECNGRSLYP